jgi:cyclase
VVLVDTKTTVDSEKGVIAEIAKVTPKTVDTVFITHSDGDHVNGLAAFPAGLTIIAQENCKKEMQASAGSRNPAPQDRLPTKTYAKTDKLTVDGVHIRLYHWANGHTSGDTVVYLPDEKIVFGGDLLVTNRPDTLIHLEKNGSAAGWIENAKGMVGLDADTYLTGHGEMMTKADVQKKLAFIQDRYNKIKTMSAQGKSLDEIKTSLGEPTAAPPPNANGAPPAATLTEVIYKEVAKKS